MRGHLRFLDFEILGAPLIEGQEFYYIDNPMPPPVGAIVEYKDGDGVTHTKRVVSYRYEYGPGDNLETFVFISVYLENPDQPDYDDEDS